jgi:hypothetical protein
MYNQEVDEIVNAWKPESLHPAAIKTPQPATVKVDGSVYTIDIATSSTVCLEKLFSFPPLPT